MRMKEEEDISKDLSTKKIKGFTQHFGDPNRISQNSNKMSRHLPNFPNCCRSSADGDKKLPLATNLTPLDDALGHSFCYRRASISAAASPRSSSAPSPPLELTSFKSISGASVSANSFTFPIYDNATANYNSNFQFRSTSSFSSIPLQVAAQSGPLDRGSLMSGPMELGGAVSGPFDSSSFSGPIDGKNRKKKGIPVMFRRSMSEKNRMSVVPLRSLQGKKCENDEIEIDDAGNGKVEWARGRAGEDRAHVVVSESPKWLFVGIYDGFNGPEALEFLVENLYKAVFDEFKGLLCEEDRDNEAEIANADEVDKVNSKNCRKLWEFLEEDKELEFSGSERFAFSMSRLKRGFGSWRKEEKLKGVKEVSRFSTVKRRRRNVGPVSDHGLVLRALERALSVTENAYFELVDRVKDFNPELAMMGSCVLVVLMRDDDVYVMNLGDSRAVVAQFREKGVQENCEDGDKIEGSGRGDMELAALQLSTDHSTSVEEEIIRIRELHLDDNRCIINGRVKGRLNVTRAFGAGYLKHPRWNDNLLAIFQNEYIGNAPYLSSTPSLYHHKLSANDQFMVLSSDGLYQYLSNEEVVSYVENFMETFPDGDPAQKLVEELLSRAAQKYGMGFCQLLDIPQGDRRKYHDDITVLVISLEGRIWKSSGRCS